MDDDTRLELLRLDLLDAWPRARAVRTRRARMRRAVPSGAALLVAAAIATVFLLRPSTDTAAAARALHQFAAKAAAQPGLHLQPGQYWYVRTVALERQNESRLAPPDVVVHEQWMARDGSGRIRIVRAGKLFDSQQPAGSMMIPFGSRSLTWAELDGLPTDTDLLQKLVEDAAVRNSWPLAYQEFDLIGELLRNAPVSPTVAKGLYEVLARLPGVTLEGRVTDGLGRSGLAVSIAGGPTRAVLVVDPVTGGLLATEEIAPGNAKVTSRFVALDPTTGKVLVAADSEPSNILYAETLAATGVVASTEARP
jgi:hypothetical protein